MGVKKPLVSIIMNCYNSDRFLREAIESVYSQTYSNWEIIFWDNASTDDSENIAKSFDDRIKYYQASETTPLGEARNLALSKVSGEYVAFLDCDDLYLTDKLDRQIAIMHGSDYAMCYGSAIMIDKNGKEIKKTKVRNKSGYILDKLLLHYEISMQSVMIRRSTLEGDLLNFDKTLTYSPDYDLFMRIACTNSIGVIHDYISQYRILDNSLSKQSLGVASTEIRRTLDFISKAHPSLKQRFLKEFKVAYTKLHYYNAVFRLYENDRRCAKREIKKIMNSKFEYLILYFLLISPLSNTKILKILGREF
jgi:glycosyltransferase involved in cell wall biosynthesis